MKRLFTLLTVAAALLFSACDCNKEAQMKKEELIEKQALKELVDTFSRCHHDIHRGRECLYAQGA